MPAKARPMSMLSFTRRKSSGTAQVQIDNLHETAKEKASHHITSKADPSRAINEAQPDAQARAMPLPGAKIAAADPDRSNPTRPRLERPLDTIRAFEAAIDGSYERGTPSRADTSDGMNGQSRRTSAYLGQRPQQRFAPDTTVGYYGNRMNMARPESAYVEGNGAIPNQPGVGRRLNSRTNSDPVLFGTNSHSVYPTHGYHQSHDTVASASGNESHNTDPWGNSTDPSSENSSIDRIQHGPKPDPAETYGFNGFGGGPILEEHGMNDRGYDDMTDYGQPQKLGNSFPIQNRNVAPPPPPPHANTKPNLPRVPIKLGSSAAEERSSPHHHAEKRKSWLKRRFSRT
ncbi:MAG: hypothetical protein Q9169_001528 [Polycauliona sp. 2 TL-2023]